MLIPDVNVLLNAYFRGQKQHAGARTWLDSALNGSEPFGVPDIVLTGFIRISTSSAVTSPLAVDAAFDACTVIRTARAFLPLGPDDRQWEIYRGFALGHARTGGDFTDAYLAALALANDATLITYDRGFARFAGLRWREPA